LKNMKCVIIDSGINPRIKYNIEDKKNFIFKQGKIICNEDAIDYYGHGTACYNIINNYYKDASFTIIKITDDGMSTIFQLEAALEYCLRINCNIVNISMTLLGEASNKTERIIKELCVEKNVKIISSYPNHAESGYPASNKYVWGIKGGYFPSNVWKVDKRKLHSKDLVLNKIPECTDKRNNNFYFFGGTSKAAALASALMMRQLSKGLNGEELFNNEDAGDFQYNSWESYKKSNEIIGNRNYRKLKNILSLNNINNNDNLIELGIIKPINLLNIVSELEKKYKIRITDDVSFSDFLTINNIANLVKRYGGDIRTS